MSEINTSNFKKEHGDIAPDLVGVTELTSPYFFVPPSGDTASRPEDCEPGTLRFNTDIGSLEVFRGKKIGWEQIQRRESQYLGGGGTGSNAGTGTRGLFMGAASPSQSTAIEFITISTLGDANDFGDRTQSGQGGQFSSSTRAVCGGASAPTYVNTVDFVTMSSTGNATDFGDKTTLNARASGCSNQIRGMLAGGFKAPAASDVIDFCTIATTGNFIDFGNLQGNREAPAGNINSPTRALWASGDVDGAGNFQNSISYVTIATTGSTQEFGGLHETFYGGSGLSSSTRGLIGGGYNPGSPQASNTSINVIQSLTIATLGNSINFGDLVINQESRYNVGSCTDCVRGIFAGGTHNGGLTNVIGAVHLASEGNATKFGDLTANKRFYGGTSNGHGGL